MAVVIRRLYCYCVKPIKYPIGLNMLFSKMSTQAKPSPKPKKKRSSTGVEIHSYIMQICVCTDKIRLERLLEKLLPILQDCQLVHFLEPSIHGCTPFYDALIMPFKTNANQAWAEEISNRLWAILYDNLQKRFPLNIRDILMAETEEGYSLLHASLYTSNSNLDKIITLLKTKGHEEALQKNLKSCSSHDIRILFQAILSKSPYRVKKTLSLLQEKGNETALQDNLDNVTKDGFMVLSGAAASHDAEIFHMVLALLKDKKYESHLQKNLLSRTHEGFMLLQHVIISGNESMIKSVIVLLQEKGNEEALHKNIKNVTNKGICILAHALSTRNPIIIHDVLSLLQREDAKEALAINLQSLSPVVLHGALVGKNKANIQSVINVLKTDINIAKQHLLTQNTFKENCLVLAISSYDFEIVSLVNDFIDAVFKAEANEKKIEFILNSNLKKTFNRDKANYQLRAYVQTIEDKITQRQFEKKYFSAPSSRERIKP